MSVNHCWVSTMQPYAWRYRGVNVCQGAGKTPEYAAHPAASGSLPA